MVSKELFKKYLQFLNTLSLQIILVTELASKGDLRKCLQILKPS